MKIKSKQCEFELKMAAVRVGKDAKNIGVHSFILSAFEIYMLYCFGSALQSNFTRKIHLIICTLKVWGFYNGAKRDLFLLCCFCKQKRLFLFWPSSNFISIWLKMCGQVYENKFYSKQLSKLDSTWIIIVIQYDISFFRNET